MKSGIFLAGAVELFSSFLRSAWNIRILYPGSGRSFYFFARWDGNSSKVKEWTMSSVGPFNSGEHEVNVRDARGAAEYDFEYDE